MPALSTEIVNFLDSLRRENASPHTIRNYESDLRQFEAHIHARRGAPPRVERLFDLDLVIA